MNPRRLAQLALARLPKPYTEEVTLHVFCEIERTPRLRAYFDSLLDPELTDDPYTFEGLNSQIGLSVKEILDADTGEQMRHVLDVCELVKYPSRLHNINSDWEFD